jgi:hypothetical protein
MSKIDAMVEKNNNNCKMIHTMPIILSLFGCSRKKIEQQSNEMFPEATTIFNLILSAIEIVVVVIGFREIIIKIFCNFSLRHIRQSMFGSMERKKIELAVAQKKEKKEKLMHCTWHCTRALTIK